VLKNKKNILGPVIRQLRLKKDLTQERFVAKLNLLGWDLSRDTFAKLESQVRWIPDSEVPILAAALDVDPGELFKLAAKKPTIKAG
jgi:transcriptional regulator with XRE-family HTH domain